MNWKYKGKEITNIKQLPEGAKGFIYVLTFSDGKKYIGRKNLYSVRKKNFGKKKLSEVTDNRKRTYEFVCKESDWLKYNSSNSFIKEALKTGEVSLESREIIKISFSDKQTTYYETQALFCYGVLEYSDDFYNDNILGKFFKRDLDRDEEIDN